MDSLVPRDNGAVPAAFAGRKLSGMLDAARAGVQASFAVLGYKGRNWRLKYRGEETLLRDPQGRPIPELDVVIVGVAPSISKIYYAKPYVEGNDDPPDCFSLDGVTPDPAAPKKQSPTCGNCPHNQWGSRITDAGKRAKECQDSRRIAVVPALDIMNESLGGPMLLRIPPTSLPNLANYADLLVRKGADFPWVSTKLGFDYDVAYPKITFAATDWLSDEQGQVVVEVMENPLIERMLLDAGPIEQAPAQGQPGAAGAEIAGKPPAAMRQARPAATVTPRGAGTPVQEPPPPGEPEPPPVQEPEPEPQPEPEPPQAAGTTVVNPFAAASRPTAAPAAPAPAPAPAKANGATRQRRVASATQQPAAAPPDLESAIDDLLEDVAG